jgi:iron complex outermembrane receptor protein
VPLNLADGSFDFQAVEALSARYVEVWRGANALLYGAATLGGAINFVSPNGYNADLFRARAEAGSFDYRRAQVSTGNVIGAFDYYLSGSLFRQAGFREHAHQDTARGFANLGYQLSPQLETRFYLGRVNSDSELPGAITKAMLQNDARQANPANVAGDQHRDIDWTRLSNKTVWRDGKQQLELFAYLSDKQLHHPIFQVINQDSRDYGAELRYLYEGELAGRRNRLTLGIAPSRGVTDEDRFVNVGGQEGGRTNKNRQTAVNLEAYAENQIYLQPQWALVAGLQTVRTTRKLDDQFVAPGEANESFDLDYRGTNPKLGLRYDYTPQIQFFANVSRSFEAPSFGELSGGSPQVVNLPDAQRANTFEIGTRGRVERIEWDVAIYQSLLRDELLQIATNSIGNSVTVNAAKTLHRGVELGLSGTGPATPGGRAEWRLNALFNDFRFRDDPTYGNARLPGLPRRFARSELGWRLSGGTLLALNAEAASSYAVDFADTLRADGYVIWGLRASGDITPAMSWFIEGRNLSDKAYAATTGVTRVATQATAAQFFPGDGRSFYAGLDWRFE